MKDMFYGPDREMKHMATVQPTMYLSNPVQRNLGEDPVFSQLLLY
jgi:hypothetical protein